MVKIGILGVGTVGESVINILQDNADIIEARAGKKIIATKGVVRDITKKRDIEIALSDNPDDILNDADIDIVVELMGGVDKPFELIQKALQKGKSVVTANKALLAYHRYELQKLASSKKDLAFGYEASVAGGIPIIQALKTGLSANHIESISGIMNGTCNYILTKMINEGADFDATLKEAQDLGYAEADPTFDIGGFDAAHKLLILASIAYGIDAKPEDIIIEGIESISPIDVEFANKFGYAIKLLGMAKKKGDSVELRVHPCMIDDTSMVAKIDGVMNGISAVGDKVGETLYYGPGAGGDATASSVIADIIDIVRGNASAMLGYNKPLETDLKLVDPKQIRSKYYLRLLVNDEAGVLAKISDTFAKYDISIETMMQKPSGSEMANLLVATHICKEESIMKVMDELFENQNVFTKPAMIRID
ncbi:MAG: homoserine dehydrogenase [Campylobacterota bacterium]